jgi:hypothetical protein
MKKQLILFFILSVVIVIAGTYFLTRPTTKREGTTSQNITKPDETANWKIATTNKEGVSFKYPNLSTSYIRAQQWPPQVIITTGGFSCTEGGLGINGLPGMTIQKTIGNTTYCIANVSEGAAGTIFTTYDYSFERGSSLIKLEFILAYPQCENYSEPDNTNCVNERQTFDLDVLVNKIAQTIRL